MVNTETLHRINKQVGLNIRHIRKANNMSLEALAKIMNVSKTQASLYESGKVQIKVSRLLDLAEQLNVDIKEFLEVAQ